MKTATQLAYEALEEEVDAALDAVIARYDAGTGVHPEAQELTFAPARLPLDAREPPALADVIAAHAESRYPGRTAVQSAYNDDHTLVRAMIVTPPEALNP